MFYKLRKYSTLGHKTQPACDWVLEADGRGLGFHGAESRGNSTLSFRATARQIGRCSASEFSTVRSRVSWSLTHFSVASIFMS